MWGPLIAASVEGTLSLSLREKELQKTNKKLLLTEERCFQMGYVEAVLKAHELGWDHKLLLNEGMADPVGREEIYEPLVVSSDLDEELSE